MPTHNLERRRTSRVENKSQRHKYKLIFEIYSFANQNSVM